MRLKQLLYLPWWFVQCRFLGKRKPLQTVMFISDRCNLQCKHCSVYNKENPREFTYDEIRAHLEYSYAQGSRFVDFEGGEVMLWRDGDRRINDLIALAKEIGFFSATITTNAQLPFKNIAADSIWVSLDGYGDFHEQIRGKGTFARLERNVTACGHKHVSFNMVVNKLNYTSVEQTIKYAAENPAIESIAINFYTPFPGAEDLTLDHDTRRKVFEQVIALKKAGYPIMNSVSGLKFMRDNNFKRRCWVTNFVYPDGSRGGCIGEGLDVCDECGLCMAGEMHALFNFRLDTIFAGLKLRL